MSTRADTPDDNAGATPPPEGPRPPPDPAAGGDASQSQPGPPFIGLEPFGEDERDRFFGRTRETRILVHKIRANKLTLLVAASGVGKSSLLEAGVKPALREQDALALLSFRHWYGDPLSQLKAAVAGLADSADPSPGSVPNLVPPRANPAATDRPLAVVLRLHTLAAGQRLVLFLDQFEELFNYQRFSGRLPALIRELAQAIDDHEAPTAFVLSMREDFAMELDAFKPHLPGIFHNWYRLEPLDIESAHLAVDRPVADRGWRWEPLADGRTLADRVLADLARREERERDGMERLADPAGLARRVEPPHLQIVCKRIWELNQAASDAVAPGRAARRSSPRRGRADPRPAERPADAAAARTLTQASYAAAGRSDGILDNHFRRALDTLTRPQQRLASSAFDLLVSQQGTKLARPLDELAAARRTSPALLDKALAPLDDPARILRRKERLEPATGQPRIWYELYHDIFSRHVRDWNRRFKASERRRRAGWVAVAVLGGVGVGYVAADYGLNSTGRYLSLSALSEIDDRIEVRSGWLGFPSDLFGKEGFLYETDLERKDLEPDKRFERARIGSRAETDAELIGRMGLDERLGAYGEQGLPANALTLARRLLASRDEAKDHELMLSAIKSLGTMRYASALQLLASSAGASSLAVPYRIAAVTLVAYVGGPKATETATGLLDDSNPSVRYAALRGLGALTAYQAAADVAGLLDDKEKSVAVAAVETLNRFGGAEALGTLERFLVSEPVDQRVVNAAFDALNQLGGNAPIRSLEKLLDSGGYTVGEKFESAVKSRVLKAAARIHGLDAFGLVMPALQNSDASVVIAALRALVSIENAQAADAIIPLLEHDSTYVRAEAVRALAHFGTGEAADAILNCLSDYDSNVRVAAAEALGTLGVNGAAGSLVRSLEDPDPFVRFAAIESLVKLGASDRAAEIAAYLGHRDPDVRAQALRALGLLRVSDLASSVFERLADYNGGVREVAIDTLVRFGAERVSELLFQGLGHPDWRVRQSAVQALARLDVAESAELIAGVLTDPSPEVRAMAAEAVTAQPRYGKCKRLKKRLFSGSRPFDRNELIHEETMT